MNQPPNTPPQDPQPPIDLFHAYPLGAFDLLMGLATSIALRHGVMMSRQLFNAFVRNDALWGQLESNLEPNANEQRARVLAQMAQQRAAEATARRNAEAFDAGRRYSPKVRRELQADGNFHEVPTPPAAASAPTIAETVEAVEAEHKNGAATKPET